MCGAPAAGKSQLSAMLRTRFAVPVINSDVVRKQLAGLDRTQRAPAELYDTEVNRRTYGELGTPGGPRDRRRAGRPEGRSSPSRA